MLFYLANIRFAMPIIIASRFLEIRYTGCIAFPVEILTFKTVKVMLSASLDYLQPLLLCNRVVPLSPYDC